VKSSILLLSLYLTGCGSVSYVSDVVEIEDKKHTDLVTSNSEVGGDLQILTIPVMVANPQDAHLTIQFVIKSAGHCQTSYEPTVFYLNGKTLKIFDFRRYFLQKEITETVQIDKTLFKEGKNIFKIETGACQYDIDVLELNKFKLSRD